MISRSNTYIATPPGATIKEQLLDRSMTQKELAYRLDVSQKHLSKLINGEVRLTPEMAIRLETVLNIPASFWNNLESIYREKLLKVQLENQIDDDIALLEKFSYDDLVNDHLVDEAATDVDKVLNLRKFFGVTKLSLLFDSKIFQFAQFYFSCETKVFPSHSLVKKVNKDFLRELVKQHPTQLTEQLESQLNKAGVTLIHIPDITYDISLIASLLDKNSLVIPLDDNNPNGSCEIILQKIISYLKHK